MRPQRESIAARALAARILAVLLAVAALLTAALSPSPAAAATAMGRVTFAFPGPGGMQPHMGYAPMYGATALATLPDGGVIVAGPFDGGIAVAELNGDGTLDRSFGQGGERVLRQVAAVSVAQVLIERDGKLLLVGIARGSSNGYPAALVLLHANGSLDTGFGKGGIAVPAGVGLSCEAGPCAAVAVQADGDIVIAGETPGAASPPSSLVVARLTPAGEPDDTFGTRGLTTVPGAGLPGPRFTPTDMVVVGPSEQLTVAGGTHSLLAQLTPTGALEQGFAGGRPVSLPLMPQGLLADADGSLLVSGSAKQTGPQHVARYDATGTLDHGYGVAGLANAGPAPTVTADPGASNAELLPAADGGVLVVTFASVGGPQFQTTASVHVAALTSTGQADATRGGPAGESGALPFGGGDPSDNGIDTNIDPDTFAEFGGAAGVRPDGSLIVASGVHMDQHQGESGYGEYVAEYAVAAFTPTLAPDGSFGARSPLALGVSLPARPMTTGARQCMPTALTYHRPCVSLTFKTSQPAVATVAVDSGGQILARDVVSLYVSGTQQAQVVLTAIGQRLLRAALTRPVTVSVTATDLAGNTARATARGSLRGS